MPIETIRARLVAPGDLASYSLDDLIKSGLRSKKNFASWGICGHGDLFWLGRLSFVGREETFLLSLLDILDARDRYYPEWGSEEVYLFAGRDRDGGFRWFLTNKDEYEENKKRAEGTRYA